MKILKYSPDALDKLKNIKSDVADRYGTEKAKKVIFNMTKAFRRLQQYEYSGVSVEKMIGIPCDYYMLFVEHNYAFYRIALFGRFFRILMPQHRYQKCLMKVMSTELEINCFHICLMNCEHGS